MRKDWNYLHSNFFCTWLKEAYILVYEFSMTRVNSSPPSAASVNQVSIGSDNGLSPIWHQAIIWTNAGLLWIGPIGTNFSKIWNKIHNFSFTKMHLKMSSVKWWPFSPGLNVLMIPHPLFPGAAYAQAENGIHDLVEGRNFPFLPTPMGKGVMPDDHDLCVAPARSRWVISGKVQGQLKGLKIYLKWITLKLPRKY